jgi:hypothetical protein
MVSVQIVELQTADSCFAFSVLVGLEEDAPMLTGAVLHARKDVPPAASPLSLLKDMAHLHFSQPRQDIACTVASWRTNCLPDQLEEREA